MQGQEIKRLEIERSWEGSLMARLLLPGEARFQ